MNDFTSLFLSQTYKDSWEDYCRSLINENYACWDYVILTASNSKQAEGYMAQITERKSKYLLPIKTKFAVIPDRGGKRIGSGGATLSAIKYVAENENRTDFSDLRILVIHSGGDSKRVPQYSALGKLFSPVPHELPNGRPSTLFDEFLISMSSVPSRIRSGMAVLSGDVMLMFNPLQIDFSGKDAAAVSFKEDVETGKEHGVFLNGENNYVKSFLHKQSVEKLKSAGAVNSHNCVNIDTGMIIFCPEIVKSLYLLIKNDKDYDKYVNDKVRLSFYGDFLYPLATDSTLAEYYTQTPEGDYSEELRDARKVLWDILSPFNLKLLQLAPAKFIHFGTTAEIMKLMSFGTNEYKELGWSNHVCSSISKRTAGINSVLSDKAKIGDNCYLEVSYVHSKANIGKNVFVSHIDVHDETIPSDTVVHCLKLNDGNFAVRIFGINDNPKEDRLFGKKINDVLGKSDYDGIIWKDGSHSLWNADIYPICNTVKEALRNSLNLYDIFNGKGDFEEWAKAKKCSLSYSFNNADFKAIMEWNGRMGELVRMDGIEKLINYKKPATEAKSILQSDRLTKIQEEWLKNHLKKASFDEKIRLNYYVGVALGGTEGDKYISNSFRIISDTLLTNSENRLKFDSSYKIARDDLTVKLPLRVNFGGGWSDTPPYCFENGGTVLNASILLNNEKAVSVRLSRTDEHKIVFDSRDMDVHGEFDNIKELQNTGNPYDPFALQKASLLSCGVIPKEGGDLDSILSALGGGFIMRSEVTGVPKGSGLGTSSILSAGCVKAIYEFMSKEYSDDDIYGRVLIMEQIMSTGGGWQDQVGGVTEGIKYITSKPGINQVLSVSHVIMDDNAKEELNERFCLIYTGQRRLARNLLRDVVGKYVGNDPKSLYAHNEIQKTAVLMKFELERGNIDEFADLLNKHWELSKMIDGGSTNTLIDQIFMSIDDLIDGKMICGAGGGGFLQVILKRNATKEQVHERLKEIFQDNSVDVWDCKII